MFYYSTENLHIHEENVRTVIVNHSFLEPRDLFEHFRKVLQMPYASIPNFAAFRDVMNELEWIPEREIRIFHETLPSFDEPSLGCYIDFLNLIDAEWEKYEERVEIVRKYIKKTNGIIPPDAWINVKPKIFNVFFMKKDETYVRTILNKYSKDFRKSIHFDERGAEYIDVQ